MNPEIARLSHEFRRKHLILPPNPNENSGDPHNLLWPAEWIIYFLSIRISREQAFLKRLTPSARQMANVFHGVRGGAGAHNHSTQIQLRNRNGNRNRPRHGKLIARRPTPAPFLLRPGEIGCDASHRKMWHQVLLSLSAGAAVFPRHFIFCEDDVNLRGDPAQVAYIRVIIQEATALNLDLVYLAWFQGYPAPPRILSEHLRAPFGDYLQLWCIYVTEAGLAKLVREFPAGNPPIIPIDVAVRRSKLLRSAVVWPPLMWTVGEPSDTS